KWVFKEKREEPVLGSQEPSSADATGSRFVDEENSLSDTTNISFPPRLRELDFCSAQERVFYTFPHTSALHPLGQSAYFQKVGPLLRTGWRQPTLRMIPIASLLQLLPRVWVQKNSLGSPGSPGSPDLTAEDANSFFILSAVPWGPA
ncbi:hypothetical protein STEG23_030184, partial [Scotinomys teguina]